MSRILLLCSVPRPFQSIRLVQTSNLARKCAHLDVFCSHRVLGDPAKVYDPYVTMSLDLLKSAKCIRSSLCDSVPSMPRADDRPFGRINDLTECNDAAEEMELADVSEVVAERLEEEIEGPDHCDLGCAIV
jgi:hypothetical protein